MKRLHFDYAMEIAYSEPVSSCHYTIKCIPQDTLRQRVSDIAVELHPDTKYSEGMDSFGNRQIYGSVPVWHERFSFRVTGNVETGYGAAARGGSACGETTDGMAAQAGLLGAEAAADDAMTALYRYPHGLNVSGEALQAYHRRIMAEPSSDAYERSLFLMHRLHQDFAYEKDCTGMTTTAEEAWKLGRGVCQDYAHILIALLQMEGIPARYVTGMLIGEGASHAWVEVLQEGKWYGIDPTNDIAVADSHIKIGSGRDASDCLINRGIVRGGGMQTQTIRVFVTETEEQGREIMT